MDILSRTKPAREHLKIDISLDTRRQNPNMLSPESQQITDFINKLENSSDSPGSKTQLGIFVLHPLFVCSFSTFLKSWGFELQDISIHLPWHDSLNTHVRWEIIQKMLRCIYPFFERMDLRNPQIFKLVQNIVRIEGTFLNKSSNWDEYIVGVTTHTTQISFEITKRLFSCSEKTSCSCNEQCSPSSCVSSDSSVRNDVSLSLKKSGFSWK